MSIAKGSRSVLRFEKETTLGELPTGDWHETQFVSETLGGNINEIKSNMIRADRATPNVRGGNIATGGNIVMDFSLCRFGMFFAHLLGSVPTTAPIVPTLVADTTAYVRGDYVNNGTAAVAASRVLTSDNTGNVTDGSVLDVGTKTYTFQSALTPLEGEILIGASADATLLNVIRAINHTGTPDVDYKCAAQNADVSSSTTVVAHTITFTARTAGTGGNAIGVSTDDPTLSFPSSTLTGGTNGTGDDYLCITGGTTSSSAATDLTDQTYNRVLTSGTAEFVYANLSSVPKYSHLFTGQPDLLDHGISIEKPIIGGDTDLFLEYSGGRVDSFALQIPQEGILQATIAMMFAAPLVREDTTQAGTPTDFDDFPVVGFEAALAIDGAYSTVLKEANFTINNMLDGEYVCGSRVRKDIVPKVMEITGTIKTLLENQDEIDRFLDEDTFSLVFSFYNRTTYCEIEFPECKFFGDPIPKVSGPGAVMLDFTFRAFKGNSSLDYPKITLKNGSASYSV